MSGNDEQAERDTPHKPYRFHWTVMISARKFGPKSPDHPSIGTPCAACEELFAAGDYTTLIPLGPGSGPTNRARAAQGKPYNAVAVEVHWACAVGSDDPQ